LALICAVSVYFLGTPAPLHLELRYILPIHYFWAMLVASSLYLILVIAVKMLRASSGPSGARITVNE
jgi:hypothetical protein